MPRKEPFMASFHGQFLSAPRAKPADGTFRQLLRTLGLMQRVLQPGFARFGITGAQWGVLCNLYRAELEGKPALRLTDLSERLLIRPPSVTGVVERLQRSRLIVRDDSVTDLRVKQIALTSRGRQLVERVLPDHAARVEALMGTLTPAEQAQLRDLLGRLENHLEDILAGGGPAVE
jgi:DNA-binding MarR family transcriptional regulator